MMRLGKGSFKDLPLMAEESLEMAFGEESGLGVEPGKDRHILLLTNQRLIRLSRMGRSREVTFLSLRDAQVAEVKDTSRNKGPLFRGILLVAGAAAALITIDLSPLAIAMALILGLGGGYQLLHYLTIPHEGSILFQAGHNEVGITFRGNKAVQAYTFINHFFQLKAPSYLPSEGHEEQRMEADAWKEDRLVGAWQEGKPQEIQQEGHSLEDVGKAPGEGDAPG